VTVVSNVTGEADSPVSSIDPAWGKDRIVIG